MKKFKHLFTALAIVLFALSVSGCKDGLGGGKHLVSVKLNASNPSGKMIHCEYSLSHYVGTNGESKYALVNNNHVAMVYIIADGSSTNFHFKKGFKNQASGSVDFELDDETKNVDISIYVQMTDDSPYDEKDCTESTSCSIK